MMIKSFDLLLLICFTQTQMEAESSHTPLLSDDTDKGVDRISGVESVASPIGKYSHFLCMMVQA